jgi:HD-GYP domain-containing protein (c-di-GMP phosphodiesterase class II)
VSAQTNFRLAEILGVFTLASDLATGQPLDHGLRRTLLAMAIGAEAGLDEDQLRDVYYVALLGSAGCVLDSAAMAGFVEDDIAFRADMFGLDLTNPVVAAKYFARTVGRGQTPARRATQLLGISAQIKAIGRDVALHVGGVIDLGPEVRTALGQCDEHWNGKGSVLGLHGEQISVAARLFRLAQDIEVFDRLGGPAEAEAVVLRRAGTYYDPKLAARFTEHVEEVMFALEVESIWDAVLAAEPTPPRLLGRDEFDPVAQQIATVIDLRSAYTVGHSPAVAALAESTARQLGLGPHDARLLHSAGLLHDLGRAGVPVAVWEKAGPLSVAERELIERHPATTELLLARSLGLGRLGAVAGLHHERLDGSGYRGIAGSSLPVTARVLAAADAYQSLREPRPHRAALDAPSGAAALRAQVQEGKLDGDVVAALLAVSGEPGPDLPTTLPDGLSSLEAQILRLVVRGMTNRQVADSLVLAPKAVGRHLESIYAKVDVSTRIGARLFAVEHGLAGLPIR